MTTEPVAADAGVDVGLARRFDRGDDVLREQCGVRVGLHTLFHFVRTRMPRPTTAPVDRPSTRRARAPSPPPHAPPTPTKTERDPSVQARIAALKERATPAAPSRPTGMYDIDR
jgi:hypothetical protein